MKRLLSILAVFLLGGSVLADKIKVYGNEMLPPMSYIENGTPRGFGVEITKAILDEAAITYTLILVPWKRAYQQALMGGGIIFGIYWTEERGKLFAFSKPLWEEQVVLVTKKGKEFPFSKIEDLQGKKIAMQRGTRPGTEFENALREKLFIFYPNNDPVSRLLMLKKERVDAAIFNPGKAAIAWNAKLAGISISEFTVLDQPLAVAQKHIAVAKSLKQNDLIDRINQAFQKIHQTGQILKILNRYK